MTNSKLLSILAGCLFSAATLHAIPTLSVSSATAAPGTTINIPINLTADALAPIASFDFDLPLPTGVTFISASTGTATLAANKSVSANFLSGFVRALGFGLNQTVIGSGSVVILRVSLAANMTPGVRTLNFSNYTLSNAAGASVAATLVAGNLTILDASAPTTPTNVSAVAVSSTRINVSWTASTDNVAVAGYRVLRGGVFVASTTTNSFANSGLAPSTNYSFTVVAYDAAGNSSATSASASATTLAAPDNTAPSVPTNVAAVAVSSTRINVSWTASTDNVAVTGYQVLRGGVQISTVTGTSFANSGLAPLTSYTYSLRAFDAAGNVSVLSSTATAQTRNDRCDINSDGTSNAIDLQVMANGVLTGSSPAAHDLNRDGVTNVIDIQLLINVILATSSCPL